MQSRIRVNKSIETSFKKEFWKGLTLREAGVLALALLLMFLVVIAGHFLFGLAPTAGVYVSVPFAAPVLIFGFRKFNGMDVFHYLKEIKYRKKTAPRLDRDTGFRPQKKAPYSISREVSIGEKMGYLYPFTEMDYRKANIVKIQKTCLKKMIGRENKKTKIKLQEKISPDKKTTRILLFVILFFSFLFLILFSFFVYAALIHFGVL